MKSQQEIEQQKNFDYRLTRLHQEDTPPRDMALLLDRSLEDIKSRLKTLGLGGFGE